MELTDRILRLPKVVALKYLGGKYRSRRRVDWLLEELEGECNLALVRAIHSYDPTKDSRADSPNAGETFLWKCVHNAAKRFLLCHFYTGVLREARITDVYIPTTKDDDRDARSAHRNYTYKLETLTARDSIRSCSDADFESGIDSIDAREMCQRIRHLVRPQDWRLLWMHYAEGMTYLEMGAVLGKPRSTVEKAMKTCLFKLRAFLRSCDVRY